MDSVRQLNDLLEDELLNEDPKDVANSSFLNVDALKEAVQNLSAPKPSESNISTVTVPPVVDEVATIEIAEVPSIVPPPTITTNKEVEASGSNPVIHQTRRKCPICRNKNHTLRFCRKFEKLNLENRFRKVALYKICYRCLSSGHISKNCKSGGTCKYCKETHHFLLHPKAKATKPREHQATSFVNVQMRQAVALSPTLQIHLCLPHRKILVRSVLDLCCQNSYICAELVSKLKIPVVKIGNDEYGRLEIESRFESTQRLVIMARVHKMDHIKTPPISVSELILEPFKGLQLADPAFHLSGKVTLVLGPEVAPMMMKGRILQSPGLPLAQYTIFGWIISGLSPY
ncbi:uncharacterized protein LOC124418751 [Lucilia cuprina]|uniref:uncharacterized protein LOC124418751 n=1 Tax=Lucilia cuprina TaxID=7375 RepID=UPI001F050C94|nr:uncharacterized protein LOC124418751 [Lucilia cuprina]